MHWIGFTAIGGVAATVTAVVVTADEVHHYPVPLSIARERLASTPLPEPLAGLAGGKVVVIREDGALLWKLGQGEHMSEGRVTLEGEGASTNATIHFDLDDDALGGAPIGGTLLTKSMAKTMFLEHVDSVLFGRPFDMQRMGMAMAKELQANPQMLEEYGAALDQQFEGVAAMLNESMAVADTQPPPDGRAATRPNADSYKPMINP